MSVRRLDYILQSLLDHKLELIEKNKNELISQVKQTSAKVKFTLKGSCVRDSENLQITLTSARERLSGLTTCLEYADDILLKSVLDQTDVTVNIKLFIVHYIITRNCVTDTVNLFIIEFSIKTIITAHTVVYTYNCRIISQLIIVYIVCSVHRLNQTLTK